MKKVSLKSIQSGLARVGIAAAVWTLLFAAAAQSKAGGDPSQGSSATWDCLFSGGGDLGIAYLTFNLSGHTITGEELLAPTHSTVNPSPTSTGRDGEGIGRTGSGSTNSTGTTNEFLFGSGPVTGNWAFDDKSNIVGSFNRTLAPVDADVSFTGRVGSGKNPRLTLSASFGQHHGTYNGVIAQTVFTLKFPDPTTNGMWFGFKHEAGQEFFEQFNLTTVTPGIYNLSGNGPDYATLGECLISSQGRIGFALVETNSSSASSSLRSTIGSFSSTAAAIKANTSGVQDNNNAVSFKATLLK
jgi:hypothetical protein